MPELSLLRRAYRRIKYWRSRNLRGCFDGLRGTTVSGWAQNVAFPAHRPFVEILEGDRVVAATSANQYRGDLCEQGIGDGCYGFDLVLPAELLDGKPHALSILIDGYLQLAPGGIRFQQSRPDAGNCPQLKGDGDSQDEASSREEEAIDALAARGRQDYQKRFARVSPAPKERLSFPVLNQPRASLVIPVHNKFELTWRCLNSLLAASVSTPFEVILIDDGSSDETLDIADKLDGVSLLRHETAQGFVGSCNEGASKARGETLVILNNDTEFTDAWLDELLWPFEHQDRVGLVGGQLIYPDGRLQESGGIFWSDASAWNYGRNENALEPRFNYSREVDYVSGACLAMPRRLWNELNGFDPIFAPGYYEDSDLAFRVREAGYRTLVAPLCKVYHLEGGSAGTDLDSGMKRFQRVNEPKFRERWQQACEGFGRPGKNADLEKDRGVVRRALVLDAQTPRPDRDAGSYAAIQEIRLLRSQGFKVSFAAQNFLFLDRYSDALMRDGVEVLFEPYYRSFAELLEQRGKEFDLIYVTRFYVADAMIDAAREFAPQAKLILNNADLHFLREMRAAISQDSQALMSRAIATRSVELEVMRKVDLVLSYNEVEHAVILSHNGAETQVAKAPWIVDIPESVPSFESRRDIAFLGSYSHPPNFEGVNYFVKDVMPRLRQRLPGTNFLIYGSDVTDQLKALQAPDVIVKGYVESVAEVYDSCRVFVVPLLSGAGLKGKVVGALAHGVPSVLSPIAVEGTGASDGKEVAVAHSIEQWVNRIQRLYEDREFWRLMSTTSRTFARNHYSADVAKQLMSKALDQLGFEQNH